MLLLPMLKVTSGAVASLPQYFGFMDVSLGRKWFGLQDDAPEARHRAMLDRNATVRHSAAYCARTKYA